MDTEITLVVFRKWKDGNIIALFPEIPTDYFGYMCSSYEHIGQHGGADYNGVMKITKPATEEESKSLAKELTRIGYNLKSIKKASYRHHENCRAEALQRMP